MYNTWLLVLVIAVFAFLPFFLYFFKKVKYNKVTGMLIYLSYVCVWVAVVVLYKLPGGKSWHPPAWWTIQ